MSQKRPKRERHPVNAYYAPQQANNCRHKPIIVYSGRGNFRLTVEEARTLRDDLSRSIDLAVLAPEKLPRDEKPLAASVVDSKWDVIHQLISES